jgi:hypothetical protein
MFFKLIQVALKAVPDGTPVAMAGVGWFEEQKCQPIRPDASGKSNRTFESSAISIRT